MDKPRFKFIALCTPSLGAVSLWWARAVADVLWPMNIGKRHQFCQDSAGGLIAETRNKIVAEVLALETETLEVDSLFWVDDDVLFHRAALLAMYNHHRPIVSGVYFLKGDINEPLIFPSRGGGTAPFIPNTTVEAWGHGMGLCLIKAEVYKRMLAAGLETDRLGNPQWYHTKRDFSIEPNNMLDCGGTEDLFFLDRAAQLGYKSLVDCTEVCFGYHYDLKTGQGYPREQFAQYAKNMPVVWSTPDGPVTWGKHNG